MLELASKLLVAYLLGAMLGSLIVGRLRGGVDIRTMGSGNAGGTNALRTQGVAFAIRVMIIDIGKGWVAAAVLPMLALPWIGIDPQIGRDWLAVGCAVAVVLGHVYPVWYGFRGGKGAATLLGVLIGLHPAALLPVMGVWLLAVMLTGFVGLATMLSVAAFPIYELATQSEPSVPLLVFGAAMLLLVCYTHRGNIERMRSGTENRARRLWLLRPRSP
jgi:acyl phosphate:glycerol-3-phosphate acyltransferase